MGNNDGGDAAGFLELQQQVQQLLGVRLRQGGSGLVQNQQAHILCQRFGDFNHLLLAGTDIFNQLTGRVFQAHHAHVFFSVFIGGIPIHNALHLALFIAKEHVLRNGHVGKKV